jgi:hypothetical protein
MEYTAPYTPQQNGKVERQFLPALGISVHDGSNRFD